jgi:hypothetical protein
MECVEFFVKVAIGFMSALAFMLVLLGLCITGEWILKKLSKVKL